MTKEEQETARALREAERDWLLARGWKCSPGLSEWVGANWSHPAWRDGAGVSRADAMALTSSDPLVFRRSR